MSDLVLHPTTARRLVACVKHSPQAVLIVAPTGSGKTSIAELLAAKMLQLPVEKIPTYPYLYRIREDKDKALGIEAVRELEHFLALRVPGSKLLNRAVIIENSHKLSLEAQNALLKTLEEPPNGTVLILTASHPQSLLPTIRSRMQQLAILPPTVSAIEDHFMASGYNAAQVKRAVAMAAGLPGLTGALLHEADHPLVAAADQAKKMLQTTMYERLLLVDELSRQRMLAERTMAMLQQIAQLSLQSAVGPAALRWQKILEASYKTDEALQKNVQPKLALLRLCLEI